MTEMPELTDEDFGRMMSRKHRKRLVAGKFEDVSGDIVALRKCIGMSQMEFALALRINVGTLRNWEQGIRTPGEAAISLLSMVAQSPSLFYQRLKATQTA